MSWDILYVLPWISLSSFNSWALTCLLHPSSCCGDWLHADLLGSTTWSYHLEFLAPSTTFEVGWDTISQGMRFSIPSGCLWGQLIQPGSTEMSLDQWGIQKTGRKQQGHFLSTSPSYRLFPDMKPKKLDSLFGNDPTWLSNWLCVSLRFIGQHCISFPSVLVSVFLGRYNKNTINWMS